MRRAGACGGMDVYAKMGANSTLYFLCPILRILPRIFNTTLVFNLSH